MDIQESIQLHCPNMGMVINYLQVNGGYTTAHEKDGCFFVPNQGCNLPFVNVPSNITTVYAQANSSLIVDTPFVTIILNERCACALGENVLKATILAADYCQVQGQRKGDGWFDLASSGYAITSQVIRRRSRFNEFRYTPFKPFEYYKGEGYNNLVARV